LALTTVGIATALSRNCDLWNCASEVRRRIHDNWKIDYGHHWAVEVLR